MTPSFSADPSPSAGNEGPLSLSLFLARHAVLHDFYLGGTWEFVPGELLCVRPHPQLNSIAWNLWHVARCEDAAVSRFVAGVPQLFDLPAGLAGGTGGETGAGGQTWGARLNLPWRHLGSGMDSAEVDALNAAIDLGALQAYGAAVAARTRALAAALDEATLRAGLDPEGVRRALWDEGLAHRDPEILLRTYVAWSKGVCLFNLALTHGFLHVGEIGVLGTLLGVSFD
jgi:hypothetical protein